MRDLQAQLYLFFLCHEPLTLGVRALNTYTQQKRNLRAAFNFGIRRGGRYFDLWNCGIGGAVKVESTRLPQRI
jgi:hypothetical protein